jgi:hypothetical protein
MLIAEVGRLGLDSAIFGKQTIVTPIGHYLPVAYRSVDGISNYLQVFV